MAAGALWRRPESGIQTSAGAIPIRERNIQHKIHGDDPGDSGYPHLSSGLHPSIESGYGVAPEDVEKTLMGKSGWTNPKFKSKPVMGGWGDRDEDFWDSLKEQLGEAGADYDVADQPFKSLAPVSIPGARHQPVANPSMLTTRGIPTGGSYNPYLGDPAKRKRPR